MKQKVIINFSIIIIVAFSSIKGLQRLEEEIPTVRIKEAPHTAKAGRLGQEPGTSELLEKLFSPAQIQEQIALIDLEIAALEQKKLSFTHSLAPELENKEQLIAPIDEQIKTLQDRKEELAKQLEKVQREQRGVKTLEEQERSLERFEIKIALDEKKVADQLDKLQGELNKLNDKLEFAQRDLRFAELNLGDISRHEKNPRLQYQKLTLADQRIRWEEEKTKAQKEIEKIEQESKAVVNNIKKIEESIADDTINTLRKSVAALNLDDSALEKQLDKAIAAIPVKNLESVQKEVESVQNFVDKESANPMHSNHDRIVLRSLWNILKYWYNRLREKLNPMIKRMNESDAQWKARTSALRKRADETRKAFEAGGLL